MDIVTHNAELQLALGQNDTGFWKDATDVLVPFRHRVIHLARPMLDSDFSAFSN